MECDYRVDPTAAPKTIDLVQPPRAVPGAVPGNEQCIAVGIYEMDGDRLKVCLRRYLPSLKTQPRPSRFAVKPNTGDVLLVLERHRLSEDEKAIQGWWAVATQVEDGKSVPNAQVRNIQFSFYDDMDFGIDSSGNQGRGGTVGQSDATGLWSLDPAKHPKTITLFAFYPFGGKKDLLGIFKFTDKELHIAYRQGGPRPEKFEIRAGLGRHAAGAPKNGAGRRVFRRHGSREARPTPGRRAASRHRDADHVPHRDGDARRYRGNGERYRNDRTRGIRGCGGEIGWPDRQSRRRPPRGN